jgi:hypothetical protein
MILLYILPILLANDPEGESRTVVLVVPVAAECSEAPSFSNIDFAALCPKKLLVLPEFTAHIGADEIRKPIRVSTGFHRREARFRRPDT